MLRATDSGSKARLIELLDRQPLAAIRIASAEDKNYEAYIAFRALGVDAVNAVPELIQIYEEKISMESQCSTADSLAEIGPIAKSAVPSLLRGLTTANAGVRLHTAQALGCIHGEPELVVPELVKLLHDSDRMTPLFAAEALGKFGTNARVAIPILIQKLKDPGTSDPFIRETVTNALKQIDPEAAAKAGVK
jgi:HEAT repeat protein